jgi:hypothetical protein
LVIFLVRTCIAALGACAGTGVLARLGTRSFRLGLSSTAGTCSRIAQPEIPVVVLLFAVAAGSL